MCSTRKHLTTRQRVFSYADRTTWALNIIAFIAAIAAGTLLPLMDLVFGVSVSSTACAQFSSLVSLEICHSLHQLRHRVHYACTVSLRNQQVHVR
jgi:hypothetical protein